MFLTILELSPHTEECLDFLLGDTTMLLNDPCSGSCPVLPSSLLFYPLPWLHKKLSFGTTGIFLLSLFMLGHWELLSWILQSSHKFSFLLSFPKEEESRDCVVKDNKKMICYGICCWEARSDYMGNNSSLKIYMYLSVIKLIILGTRWFWSNAMKQFQAWLLSSAQR